jgi:hypothetical protein
MQSHTHCCHRISLLLRSCIALAATALACALAGCAGHGGVDQAGAGPVPGAAFASPAQLISLLNARGVSAAGLTKTGAQYATALPSAKVAINGAALDFAPTWDAAGSPAFGDLAFAIYLFDGTGLSGASAVTTVWPTAPAAADLWVGLADFASDRWTWFQPAAGVPYALADLSPYIDPADSRVLVACVLTGTAASSLGTVTLGEYVPEFPLPAVPLSPAPMGGNGLAGPVLADGNPALAYIEDNAGASRLIFIRALDSDGTTWGAPVVIADGAMGSPGMQIIDGKPALAYQADFLGTLLYRLANDAQGSSWGAPVTVDATTAGAGNIAELLVIDGRPAIAYLASGMDNFSQPALYIRADDAAGSAWSAAPLVLNPEYATGDQARYMSFAVIDGNPAVAYNWVSMSSAGLRYVRATDAAGGAWGAPVNVPGTGYDTANMLRNVDLVDLGGLPGVGYFIEDFGVPANCAVYFTDAQDAVGAVWDAPQVVLAAAPGEDPVNFGSLYALTRLDGTQRALAVATRDGAAVNDQADVFVATVPLAGGADFSTGTKHMRARFQLAKSASILKRPSCFDSVDMMGLLIFASYVGDKEMCKILAAMQGYDTASSEMGVSTTSGSVPAENF